MLFSKVAIIIINYNTAELTTQAVNKLERSEEALLNIVIIDNGSKESDYYALRDSFDFVKTADNIYCTRTQKGSEITLIRSEYNLGFAKGNNLGLRYIIENYSLEYALLMNSDIFIEQKGVISKLVSELEKCGQENAVAIMPLVNNIYIKNKAPNCQIQIRKLCSLRDFLICNSPFMKRICLGVFREYIYQKNMPFEHQVKAYVLSGAFMLVNMEFLIKIGLFDENTFLYMEELILGEYMKRNGNYAILEPSVMVNHLQGSSSNIINGFSSLSFIYNVDSSLYYCKRFYSISNFNLVVISILKFIEGIIYSIFLERSIRGLFNYTRKYLSIISKRIKKCKRLGD